jgi:hypothetical protein
MILVCPEAVWAVLSDGAGWSTSDSGIDEVEGRIEIEATINKRSQAAPDRTVPVTVTTFDGRLRFGGDLGPSFDRFAQGLTSRLESDG